MLYITSFKNVRKMDYDRAFAIVYSMINVPFELQDKQLECLAPDRILYSWYLSVRDNPNEWNENTFKQTFAEKFVYSLVRNRDAMRCLEILKGVSHLDMKVALCCFCKNECLCHRSILAGILKGMGANVKTDFDVDYSCYYEMFLKHLEVLNAS